jgi:hypothetical protein
MEKKLYNIIMMPGVPELDLLENEAKDMELKINPDLFDGLITMKLTEEEASIIIASGKVKECLVEPKIVETAYPTSTPRYESGTVTYRTRYIPGGAPSSVGATSTGLNMFFTSEFTAPNGTPPFGWFQDPEYRFTDTVKQNFAGDYVDIVAIEAGTPNSTNAGHINHPDFAEIDSSTTRFIPMDWSDVSSSLNDSRNNQIGNLNDTFSSHAIGVLSAAGGKHCGWGKNSSLRVIYLADGVTAAYYGVLSWHINKPVNPATGVRNATVVTGAWGYGELNHEKFYRCDHIQSLTVYDKDTGASSVINRPVGNSWGTDLTPFENNVMIPRVLRDPTDNSDYWCISVPNQSRDSVYDTIMSQFNFYNGIYNFKSAGNDAHVFVQTDDPRYDNKIVVGIGAAAIINNPDAQGRIQLSSSTTTATEEYFPLRTRLEGGPNDITIAACQQDDVNRLMDDYSARGPGIDFAAYGSQTWTSYPTTTYADGKWGYFSGTSCAAPVAAGCATIFLDHWFTQRGVFPSIAQLKETMIKHAKSNLIGEDLFDFSNIVTAGDYGSAKLYNANEVNRLKDNNYMNAGAELSELYGTPPLRVHIPWSIRMGSGKYIAGGSEATTSGRRPESGRTWPRQKNVFSV